MVEIDLEVTRGDYVAFDMYFSRLGVPIDLTGASISFVVRPAYPAGTVTDDTDAVINLTVGSGINIASAASGLAQLVISEANTYGLSYPTGKDYIDYVYEIKLQTASDTGPTETRRGNFRVSGGAVRGL